MASLLLAWTYRAPILTWVGSTLLLWTLFYTLPLHFGKVITGSHGGETDPTVDIPRYVKLYQAEKLRLRELITDRMPLARINEAIEKMRSGALVGRCILEVSPDPDRG